VIACPQCGFEAPDDFAFCPKCATALVPACAAPEERKTVTTLFCDLVAFTAMSEAADPEDVDAVLRRYHAAARKVIGSHGGTVEKFIGDAVVGVFGVPAVHEDDPERAVRAGLRIVEALEGMTRPDGSPLQVRVGVNTGEALVRLDVTPGSGEGFLTGDAVNTAARLQAAAPAGGVAVGATAQQLSAAAIEYEDLPPVIAKGKSEPVAAWLAKATISRTGADAFAGSATPFVGREVELAYLKALFDKATSATPQFALVVGEPGIGKSRLVQELFAHVDARPEMTTWRQGRCLPYGEGVTFWALGEIVKSQAGILDTDSRETVETKLEAVLPDGEDRVWFGQRLRPLLGLESPAADREENFTAWLRFLEEMTASGPTVLVFEDLHWADEALLGFLEHLSSHMAAVPLMVVGTARPELFEKHAGFATGGSRVNRIGLEPLSGAETERLVASLLAGPAASADAAAEIAHRCDGNPFYAEESVRLLAETAQAALPASVRAVIAARLDALPAGQKAVLGDAAVIGGVFWNGAVAALDGRDTSEVDQALRRLVDRQLVRRVRASSMEGENEFAFAHALVREVAYQTLPRSTRATKHASTATWLERKLGDRAEGAAEVLAHHYVTALDLARVAGNAELADALLEPVVRFSSVAGERSVFIDLSTAERHFARALELAGDSPLRLRPLAGWGEVLFQRARPAEAFAMLREAAEGLKEAGDVELAAQALTALSKALQHTDGSEAALSCAREAVALLEDEELSETLVDSWVYIAWDLVNTGDLRGSIEAAETAMRLAARLGIPVPAGSLGARGSARLALGDLEGLRDYELALDAARSQGLTYSQVTLSANVGVELWLARGPGSALEVWRNALHTAQERGIHELAIVLRACVVEATSCAGEWDEAIRLAEALDGELVASGNLVETARTRMTRALILLLRGQRDAARQAIEWGLASARESSGSHSSFCSLVGAVQAAAEDGNRDTAVGLLGELATRPISMDWPEDAFTYPHGVRAALWLGEVQLAERLLNAIEPTRLLNEHVLVTGSALLAEARGELKPAANEFGEAAERWHDFGVPYEEAQALLGQGRCLVALGRAPEAAAPLAAAREIFARLGARPALEETDAVLARDDGL
jgi:class 3 adenylate cyclase/tetratricopeptide (TPR) repeat protein